MNDSNQAAQTTIRQREDALYRAMISLDYAALNDLLSDDLSYEHSTGGWKRNLSISGRRGVGSTNMAQSPGAMTTRWFSPAVSLRVASSICRWARADRIRERSGYSTF